MITVAPVLPATPDAAAMRAEFADDSWLAEDMSGTALDVGGSDLDRVLAASGAVEALEWQLDRAQSALVSAIERAACNGYSVEEIAESSGMTKADIATVLWAARSERSQT